MPDKIEEGIYVPRLDDNLREFALAVRATIPNLARKNAGSFPRDVQIFPDPQLMDGITDHEEIKKKIESVWTPLEDGRFFKDVEIADSNISTNNRVYSFFLQTFKEDQLNEQNFFPTIRNLNNSTFRVIVNTNQYGFKVVSG